MSASRGLNKFTRPLPQIKISTINAAESVFPSSEEVGNLALGVANPSREMVARQTVRLTEGSAFAILQLTAGYLLSLLSDLLGFFAAVVSHL